MRDAKNHALEIKVSGRQTGERREIHLVKGGPRAYLWIGMPDEFGMESYFGYISGPATLRRLAKAILKEVGTK